MLNSPIEEIKTKLNIVDVVSEYVQLKRVGANYKARCPFHQERTPSFHVNTARQIWHCFGCGLGGDVIEFVKQIESLDFPQALKLLADRAGVALPQEQGQRQQSVPAEKKKVLYELNDLASRFYHKILTESPAASTVREYLDKRKFKKETIISWQLGYAADAWDTLVNFLSKRGYDPKDMEDSGLISRRDDGRIYDRFRGRITFPIRDLGGRVVGFSARVLQAQNDIAKYINSPETLIYSKSKVLFGLFEAKSAVRQAGAVVVVEGNIDAIKSSQAGLINVVASSGTALTEYQLQILKRLTDTVVFAFDADAAGLMATRRALDGAVAAGLNVRLVEELGEFKDPDEIIDADPEVWKNLIRNSTDYLQFYFRRLFDILPLTDPTAKAKAVQDFFSLLGKVADPIIVSEYVKKVSQTLAIRERDLIPILERARSRPSSTPSSIYVKPPVKPSAQEKTEQRYLGLICRFPGLSAADLRIHDPGEFTREDYRKIFSDLLAWIVEGKNLDTAEFLVRHPSYRTVLEVAEFSLADAEEEALKQELEQMSVLLRRNFIRRERERLSIEIAKAERRGDDALKKELAFRYTTLVQTLQELEFHSHSLSSYGRKKEEAGQT